jgi:hypothetical protein
MMHDEMNYSNQIKGFSNVSGAISNYAMSASANTAPRELGVLDRMGGVEAGLSELVNKLETFADRCTGPSPKKGEPATPPAGGLLPSLSRTEHLLRRAHELINALHDTF